MANETFYSANLQESHDHGFSVETAPTEVQSGKSYIRQLLKNGIVQSKDFAGCQCPSVFVWPSWPAIKHVGSESQGIWHSNG